MPRTRGVPLEFSDDPDELVATLQEIFKQVLSVSTTFVAASVPVNVFNRAEITDNVYIALFQVDGDGRPSWVGNVKKLKLLGEPYKIFKNTAFRQGKPQGLDVLQANDGHGSNQARGKQEPGFYTGEAASVQL